MPDAGGPCQPGGLSAGTMPDGGPRQHPRYIDVPGPREVCVYDGDERHGQCNADCRTLICEACAEPWGAPTCRCAEEAEVSCQLAGFVGETW